MNCTEWEEKIALYTGGELTGHAAAEVEEHFGQCVGCQVFASGMRQSLDWLKSAHQDVPDPAHFAAVRARVLSELRGTGHRLLWSVFAAAAAIGAVLLLMLMPRHAPKLVEPTPVVAEGPSPVTAPVVRLATEPKRRTGSRRRRVTEQAPRPREPEEARPLVVKLVTEDPNVVIYWISENRRGE